MLSHISVLILGIIAERPVNPYEIKKLFEKIEIRKWLPVATSSIYLTVRELNKKGYCEGVPSKEGNMPEKTVYSVTEKGKAALIESLEEYLRSTDLDRKKYQISSLMLCHLKQEEAIKILGDKLENLQKKMIFMERSLENMRDSVPYTGLSMLLHELSFMNAEISSVEELLHNIRQDDNWNYFVTRDLLSSKQTRKETIK